MPPKPRTVLVELWIETDTPTHRVQDELERALTHRFLTWGIDTIVLEDTRTTTEQATDDHNEGVAMSLGWPRYVRTDGTPIDLAPRILERDDD
jgi:hypothetical protein